jgi:demethylspheroidene O-methyltransferase
MSIFFDDLIRAARSGKRNARRHLFMVMHSEGWINRRNRILSNPKFQRFLATFPLTRAVTRWKARSMFTMVTGFVYSQILCACIELKLLNILRDGPLLTEEVASRCAVPHEAALALLKAAASLNLTELTNDGRYALGQDGAALLGNPGIAEMVIHHRVLYADLADPVALLRRGGGAGELSAFWPYSDQNPEAAGRYSALMAATQPMIAEQVLDAVSLKGSQTLLDIGGGEGVFLTEVAKRWPALSLAMLDLPAVAERGHERLGARATVYGGSFLDPLPGNADTISLVRILHDHDDVVVAALLENIKLSLPVHGKLIIAEPMADTPSARAMGHGYFGMYLLAMGSGRPRTATELHTMLRDAGFSSSREVRTNVPMTCRVIIARA